MLPTQGSCSTKRVDFRSATPQLVTVFSFPLSSFMCSSTSSNFLYGIWKFMLVVDVFDLKSMTVVHEAEETINLSPMRKNDDIFQEIFTPFENSGRVLSNAAIKEKQFVITWGSLDFRASSTLQTSAPQSAQNASRASSQEFYGFLNVEMVRMKRQEHSCVWGLFSCI